RNQNKSTASLPFQTLLSKNTAHSRDMENLEVVKIDNVPKADFSDWWYRLYQLMDGYGSKTGESGANDMSLDNGAGWSHKEIQSFVERIMEGGPQKPSPEEVRSLVEQISEGKGT